MTIFLATFSSKFQFYSIEFTLDDFIFSLWSFDEVKGLLEAIMRKGSLPKKGQE